MARRVLGTAVAAATVVAFSGQLVATAAVKPPTKVAALSVSHAPSVLVDSKGTVVMAYTAPYGKPDQYGQVYDHVRVARKTKSAKKFSVVRLPTTKPTLDPILFQPAKRVLEVVATVNGPLTVIAWRSTNDGKTWKSMDTSYINDPALRNAGVYIASSQLQDVAGGPVQNAGNNGDPLAKIIQITPDLKHVKTLATDSTTAYQQQFGKTPGGVLFQVGIDANADGATNPFEIDGPGSKVQTGTLKWPTCATTAYDFSLAVGKSNAVVLHSACGHVWSHTISTSGALGKLVTLGAGDPRYPTVNAVADRKRKYTAVFANAGGDEGIARSSNGTKWKTSKGALPTVTATTYGTAGALSRGSALWFGYGHAGTTGSLLSATPLSNTYTTPKSPSGVKHAKHAHLGSLAVSAPKKISAKSFRPHGNSTVRLVDEVKGPVTVSISVERNKKTESLDLCGGSKVVKAKAGKPVTVHLGCAGGGIVIGGAASSKVPVKKGDDVSYSFVSRNGTLNVASKIS